MAGINVIYKIKISYSIALLDNVWGIYDNKLTSLNSGIYFMVKFLYKMPGEQLNVAY